MNKKHILVVDDDETIRRLIARILELEGYQVDTAATGEEAIRKSKSHFYNLALIDIRLPDMEGTELLTAMQDTVPKMVKIILTGYPTLQNSIKSINKGADGYLIKPIVDNASFLQMVCEHLKKQERSTQDDQEKIAHFVKKRIQQLNSKDELAK